jgi:hypothetical protein
VVVVMVVMVVCMERSVRHGDGLWSLWFVVIGGGSGVVGVCGGGRFVGGDGGGDGGGVCGLHQEVGVCLARDDLLPSVDWLVHWLTPELLQFPDQLGLHA